MLVFLIFLFISSSIWFINTLRKNYISAVAFSVKYTNFPKDKLSIGEIPPYLILQIKTSGYTLLLYKIKPPSTMIELDLNEYTLYRMSDISGRQFILTSSALYDIDQQVPSDIKVLDVKPDTIYFQFDKVYKKKVPVVPAVKIEFKKQFALKDVPAVKPDCVYVYGPKVMIDTIRFVKTVSALYKNISQPITKRLELQKKYGLTYSVNHVNIDVPVEKFTEATITLPVEIKNVPDSLQLKIIPKYISLTCRVGLSNFDKIKPYYFKASVDFKDTKDKLLRKLKVQIDEYPRMISGVRYHPQKVDFLIKRKYK